jgi:hypothetical protein
MFFSVLPLGMLLSGIRKRLTVTNTGFAFHASCKFGGSLAKPFGAAGAASRHRVALRLHPKRDRGCNPARRPHRTPRLSRRELTELNARYGFSFR